MSPISIFCLTLDLKATANILYLELELNLTSSLILIIQTRCASFVKTYIFDANVLHVVGLGHAFIVLTLLLIP